MKKSTNLFLLVIIVLFLYSCIREDGDWKDNIKLSTKEAEFGAERDSIIITTKGTGWWIDGISVNDSTYSYYHRDDIDIIANSYTIEEDCFTVEKRDNNTLFIKMEENLKSEERLMTIILEAGDYFDYIKIRQAGK